MIPRRSVSFQRPEPPYYAVIITTLPSGEDPEGYAAANVRIGELSRRWPGYLGRECETGPDGRDLLVVYFADAESIAAWKNDPDHLEAQRLGRERWYASYTVEVACVERSYGFTRD